MFHRDGAGAGSPRRRNIGDAEARMKLMVGIDLRHAMRGAVTVALVAGTAIVHSSCAGSRAFRLPPPPSEQLRSEFGTVRVTSGSSDVAMVFGAPAGERGKGAMRGAGKGVWLLIDVATSMVSAVAP
jgi:hypothetical protein